MRIRPLFRFSFVLLAIYGAGLTASPLRDAMEAKYYIMGHHKPLSPKYMDCGESLIYHSAATFIQLAEWLRYRVSVRFEDTSEEAILDPRKGTLLVLNHPTWGIEAAKVFAEIAQLGVKPLIVVAEGQLQNLGLGTLAKLFDVVPIPDMTNGNGDLDTLNRATDRITKALNEHRLVVIAGSGRLYRSRTETLGSMVAKILATKPDARVVSAYADGLWGSRFGFAATGEYPNLRQVLLKGIASLFANGIFFSPRHPWSLTFREETWALSKLPPERINEFFKQRFNTTERGAGVPRMAVLHPLTWFGRRQNLPEPIVAQVAGDIRDVSREVRQATLEQLVAMTGDDSLAQRKLDDPELLAMNLRDNLGLDSLKTAELILWIEKYTTERTGTPFVINGTEHLQTVQDLMLAANGAAAIEGGKPMALPSRAWLKDADTKEVLTYDWDGVPYPLVWLKRAIENPDGVTVADPMYGSFSNRKLIQLLLAILPSIEKMKGDRVGVLLVSGMPAFVATMAIRLAGKVPVFINHTTGIAAVRNAIELTGINQVLTSSQLLTKVGWSPEQLQALGAEPYLFEDIRKSLTTWDKLDAFAGSYLGAAKSLLARAIAPEAGILVTSGSEGMPKLIQFTDTMFGVFLQELLRIVHIHRGDRVLQTGPPFHVLGYIAGIVLPALIELRVGVVPDPTDNKTLAAFAELYQTNRMVSPPAFAGGMASASLPGQIEQLQHLVYGAAAMGDNHRQAIVDKARGVRICEGYGATETTGGLMFEPNEGGERGWMQILDSVEYKLMKFEEEQTEVSGGMGVLFVRGPTVIESYLQPVDPTMHADSSAFVSIDGKTYFRTGDLVERHPTNPRLFKFVTRVSRTYKNEGGEFVNPDLIERALNTAFPRKDGEKGELFSVNGAAKEHYFVSVLLTTREMTIAQANEAIFAAGHEATLRVDQVHQVKALPMAGSGKINLKVVKRWAGELQKDRSEWSEDLIENLVE